MASRARLHSKKAREIEWNSEQANHVRSYIVDLTADTTKLYKALSSDKLGKIDGFGDLGESLSKIIEDKEI
ncbi:hypothetical protein RRF57_009392 [Xylaria bambusicola]|uniref:Uncharacterized protein n=1 Tax=Xylaria bambusicola TaxID=326684 RepID=A0AAN7UUW9_9PEZI